jgi:hypothetical protein
VAVVTFAEVIERWLDAHPGFDPKPLSTRVVSSARRWIVTPAGRAQYGLPVDAPDVSRTPVSRHGARIAAGRLGITVDEYRAHEAAGERWCSCCGAWRPSWRRADGKRGPAYCPPCWRVYQRELYHRRKRRTGAAS